MSDESQIVQEVRQRARAVSLRFDDDLEKYVEHLRAVQARYSNRLVDQVRIVRDASPPVGHA